MTVLRLISDIHGNITKYYNILKGSDYSIQLGDLSYDYSKIKHRDKRRVGIFGNHDNFHAENRPKQYWPHGFGYMDFAGIKVFYVSGAFSVDWKIREKLRQTGEWQRTWFEEEQLPQDKLQQAIDYYNLCRPDFVITHEAPRSIIQKISPDGSFLKSWGYDPATFRTPTDIALDIMFQTHKPTFWHFAHHHKDVDMNVDGTRFVCRREFGYTDIIIDNSNIMEINPK